MPSSTVYYIGNYQSPFPYQPYALQVHAVDALRTVLSREKIKKEHPPTNAAVAAAAKQSNEDEDERLNATMIPHSAEFGLPPPLRLAVLESPTGTGKSHMLLSATLSHLFALCTQATVPGVKAEMIPAKNANNGTSTNNNNNNNNNRNNIINNEGHSSYSSICDKDHSPPRTLAEAIARAKEQQQYLLDPCPAPATNPLLIRSEDDRKDPKRVILEALRGTRRERRRQERKMAKQLRLLSVATQNISKALKRSSRSGSTAAGAANEDEEELTDDQVFLVQQDPAALLREMQTSQATWEHGGGQSLSQCLVDCSSSSSSDSDQDTLGHSGQRQEDGDDDDDHDPDDEEGELGWLHLARHVPLRRPKLYIASRTHTQLEQMRRDIQDTVFAQQFVRSRLSGFDPSSGADNDIAPSAAHPLTVLHMASRSQLCINQNLITKSLIVDKSKNSASHASSPTAPLSGAAALLLNEACADAIQFENSAEGRKARRRQMQQQAGLVAFTTTAATPVADIEDTTSRFGVGEAGTTADRGCPYAIPSRLRAFLRYIQKQEGKQHTHHQEPAAQSNQKNTNSDPNAESDPPLDTTSGVKPPAGLPSASSNSTTSTTTNNSNTNKTARTAPVANSFSLEEMVALGKSLGACPYLVSRLLLRGADVALLPYTYLVDEDQRQHLLGGGSTNPVTEEEEEQLVLHLSSACPSRCGMATSEALSTSSVAVATPAARSAAAARGNAAVTAPNISIAAAAALPPDCRGDFLVLDEAHNLAEQCLQTSTTEISTHALQLVSAVLNYYLRRYQTRLLAINKQRLRELVWWVDHILGFLLKNGTRPKGIVTSTTQSHTHKEEEELLSCSFHDFLFDAGIDHVDVHVLYQFLQSSRLQHKLRGLVAMILAQHNKKVIAREEQRENESRAIKYARRAVKRPRALSPSHGSSSDAPSDLETAALRVVGLLLSVGHPADCSVTMHPTLTSSSSGSSSNIVTSNSNVNQKVDLVHALRIVSSSLVDFYRLLRWCEYSDGDTKVLYRDSTLRLLQLEPGKHTLVPLLEQMGHTILAGGTMRPLPLSVYPLIPNAYRYCNEEEPPLQQRVPQTSAGSTLLVGRGGWQLISEPHVVPPTSLQVWALGSGPSGEPWGFAQSALTAGAEPMGVSGSAGKYALRYSAVERRVFQDLASALLNFARVLPPEGVICFLPSYRFQYRFLRFLRDQSPSSSSSSSSSSSTGLGSYEAAITSVKKIFSEVILEEEAATGVSSSSVSPGGGGGGGHGIAVCPEHSRGSIPRAMGHFASTSSSSGAEAEDAAEAARLASAPDERSHAIRKRHAEGLMREYAMWIEGHSVSSGAVEQTTRDNAGLGHSSTPPRPPAAASLTRGALLFAVIGGKLSEGLNFSDHLGRAVLVVGLPYANPQESTTRSFLSHIAAASYSISSPMAVDQTKHTNQKLFQLYTDLCMRQVNQSIGRCIRHRGDYAVAILLDTRYTQRNLLQSGLSAWMQPSVRVAQNFGECFRGIRTFFQEKKAASSAQP